MKPADPNEEPTPIASEPKAVYASVSGAQSTIEGALPSPELLKQLFELSMLETTAGNVFSQQQVDDYMYTKMGW